MTMGAKPMLRPGRSDLDTTHRDKHQHQSDECDGGNAEKHANNENRLFHSFSPSMIACPSRHWPTGASRYCTGNGEIRPAAQAEDQNVNGLLPSSCSGR